MGYDTYFCGDFQLDKEPNDKIKAWFKAWNDAGRQADRPPKQDGEPENWCDWQLIETTWEISPTDGKNYGYIEWIEYICENVLKPNGSLLNGEVYWEGDERDDIGKIIIKDNIITILYGEIIYKTKDGIPEEEL